MITSVYARLVEESYEDMADQVYGPPASSAPVVSPGGAKSDPRSENDA